jgi:hypothetical protein
MLPNSSWLVALLSSTAAVSALLLWQNRVRLIEFLREIVDGKSVKVGHPVLVCMFYQHLLSAHLPMTVH